MTQMKRYAVRATSGRTIGLISGPEQLQRLLFRDPDAQVVTRNGRNSFVQLTDDDAYILIDRTFKLSDYGRASKNEQPSRVTFTEITERVEHGERVRHARRLSYFSYSFAEAGA